MKGRTFHQLNLWATNCVVNQTGYVGPLYASRHQTSLWQHQHIYSVQLPQTGWLSGRVSDLRSKGRGFEPPAVTLLRNNIRQVVHTPLPHSRDTPRGGLWITYQIISNQKSIAYRPLTDFTFSLSLSLRLTLSPKFGKTDTMSPKIRNHFFICTSDRSATSGDLEKFWQSDRCVHS